MNRKPRVPGSKKIHPLLTPQFHGYLADLVDMGHGPTAADAARYLIQREIDDMLRAKILRPRGPNGEKIKTE